MEGQMKFKKILSLALVFGMVLAIPAVDQENVLNSWNRQAIFMASESGRDEAQRELDEIRENLDGMEDELADLESQMSEKVQALSDLMADQAIIEADIVETQVAIDQAKIDLKNAKIKEQEAYDAMKLRIQYMYENSTQDSIWDAILNADGITDLINRVEYINQVHDTDRQMLDEYKGIVENIEILTVELETSMNDLLTLQEIYEHQELELEDALAELEADADDYEAQIAAAEARADQLSEYIEEQNRLIELEEEDDDDGNSDDEDDSDDGGGGTAGGYLNDPSYDPEFVTDISGETLVNYALQFVGNPYKWGGNSLTDGCDCSGFVNLIYRHFGFTGVPRQSQAFKTYGRPVAFCNIKPGDIVIYPGHVAIYIGNGKIVEAQSSRAGITCNRSVTCNTITGIRRVL